MQSRRIFLASAAGALAAPALAQTANPQGGFQLDPELEPRFVRMPEGFEANTIYVYPRDHFLYYVTEDGRKAIRYGVGVGKAGLDFQGRALIQVKKEWPTWRPTDEMIERDPRAYQKFIDNDYVMPGGPGNPLGARALYLFKNGRDTYYRIHGTTDPTSIGRSVSNGCIRMLNNHVGHLYNLVPIGTTVYVA